MVRQSAEISQFSTHRTYMLPLLTYLMLTIALEVLDAEVIIQSSAVTVFTINIKYMDKQYCFVRTRLRLTGFRNYVLGIQNLLLSEFVEDT